MRRHGTLLAIGVVLLFAAAAPSGAASDDQTAGTALPKVRIAADGRTFDSADGKPFVPLGVNYYRPGTGWAPQLWKQFDADATRRDFEKMKDLGVNCVRVFLSFGSFYQEPGRLDPAGLAKFDEFLSMAEAAGIYVHPTGPDHWEGLPEWARTDHYADERTLEALEQFWRLFAARYRGRNVLFAYDLKNEPAVGWIGRSMSPAWNRWLQARYGSAEQAAAAWGVEAGSLVFGEVAPPPAEASPGSRRLLDYQHFREQLADEWTRRQAVAIKSADPEALVTVGLIQWSVPALLPGIQHYSGFRPSRQAKLLDFLEIHFYPLADGFLEYARPEDEDRNAAYLESVVREVAAAGRPVVVAEFGWYGGGRLTIDGGRRPAADEASQARWCRRAVETTEGLATGWLNWGFYDHPQARDVSQLTGLLTVDGREKAWAREFRGLAGRLTTKRIAPAALGPRPDLDWDRLLTDPSAAREFREAYYRAFQAGR